MVFGNLSSAQTNAAAAPPDVRVLVDVSASMHERDANKLREAAMRTLVQQLPEKAVAGVWGYAQLTQRFANHAQSSALWKQVAVIHAEHLSSASKNQNPEQAFGNILWDLDKPDRAPIHVVWLSNGGFRLGSEQASEESRTRLLSVLANKLAASRVVVHTMAVGPLAEGESLHVLS